MSLDAFTLDGKVAVVTGGGTGIGAATCRLFAEHGAAGLVLAARTESEIERVAGEIAAASPGCRTVAIRADVKDEESVLHLVERTMEEFGRVDVLVNNRAAPAWARWRPRPPRPGTRCSV